MVLHTGKGPNVLMSIPRDSLVEIPGHGTTKINAAFAYGGPRLLTRTVEQNTKIHIDDYVEIGFNGFVSLVDAVGGIQICPKEAIKDELAHLDVPKGCQEADGKTALGYSRARHAFALGDIERAQHQREVVSAIGHEVLSWKTVVNPVRYYRVVTGGARSVRLGEGTGPVALGQFALAMNHVNGKDGLTCGVPIADLAVHWDTDRSEQLFTLLRQNRADEIGKQLCTPTGRPQ
jgi:LCP family protein required for cell wall assembly